VARWLWPGERGGPRTLAQVRAMMVRDADHWRRHRFGPWVLRDRATGEAVGRAGLQRTVILGRDQVELVWLIAASRWGEGLATEVARAAIEAAGDELALAELVATTLPDNAASRAVMERCGLRYEADVEHAGLPHVLYRRTKAES